MRSPLLRTLLAVSIAIMAACSWMSVRTEPGVSVEIDFVQLREEMRAQFSEPRVEVLDRWQTLLGEIRGEVIENQLSRVNEFFHRNVRYQVDQQLYGQEDYWASLLQTLGHGRGDCEDWAIAKYVSLRYLGVPDQSLRLIYVRARIGGPRSPVSQAHMVLGYYPAPNAEPIILDSLIGNVLPASERSDLSPVFSFNADGLWIGQGPAPAAGTPTARLSLWRDVIARMQREGIAIQ